jgi:hypothetical protein
MAISMRRRGIARFARRKFDRRLAVFGSIVLLYFTMQRVASEEGIIFFLFQPAWGIGAFLIAGGDITGDRLTLGFGLGALEDNDVSGHNYSLLSDAGSSSSPSLPSSSVNPNNEVTGCRMRVAFFCFSINVWHSTV